MPVNASHEQELKNPWQDKDSLPKASKDTVILAFIAVALCALAFPFSSFEYVTLGVLAVLFIYVVRTARLPSVVTAVLVTTVLIGMIDIWGGAAALCLIVGACGAAFLFTVLRRPYLVLLPFLAAFGIAFLISRDWRIAALTFAFLPAAILLAIATKHDEGRTSTICWTIAGFLIAFVGVLLYLLWTGSMAMGVNIREYIDILRGYFSNWMYSFREYFFAGMQQASTPEMMETIKEMEKLLSKEYFDEIAAMLFNLIPAGVVILCSVLAFNAQLLLTAQYRSAGMEKVVTPSSRIFTMSWLSGVLFMLSFAITMFATENSMFLTVASNLCLMLLPGLCVRAVIGILFGMYRMKGRGKSFFIILIAVMLCCNFFGAFYFLAFWGAYQSIMEAVQRRLLEKMKQQNGDRPPHDNDEEG